MSCIRVVSLHVYVLVDILDFVIVLFQSVVLSAWLLLHVYVLVDVLDFVIVVASGWCFRIHIICVLMVVATRVCFGSRSRLRYRVVSEWCFRIHIFL